MSGPALALPPTAGGPPQAWAAGTAPQPQTSAGRPGRCAASEGPCVRRYSPEAQALQRRCTCCRETRARQAAVALRCPDGTAVRLTYTHVEQCSCNPACEPSPEAPGDRAFDLLS